MATGNSGVLQRRRQSKLMRVRSRLSVHAGPCTRTRPASHHTDIHSLRGASPDAAASCGGGRSTSPEPASFQVRYRAPEPAAKARNAENWGSSTGHSDAGGTRPSRGGHTCGVVTSSKLVGCRGVLQRCAAAAEGERAVAQAAGPRAHAHEPALQQQLELSRRVRGARARASRRKLPHARARLEVQPHGDARVRVALVRSPVRHAAAAGPIASVARPPRARTRSPPLCAPTRTHVRATGAICVRRPRVQPRARARAPAVQQLRVQKYHVADVDLHRDGLVRVRRRHDFAAHATRVTKGEQQPQQQQRARSRETCTSASARAQAAPLTRSTGTAPSCACPRSTCRTGRAP